MPGGYYEEQPSCNINDRMMHWSRTSPEQPENEDLIQSEALCARFKKTLSQKDVKVHFVGVW
jgi:uncharacterized protein (DUF2235 family)